MARRPTPTAIAKLRGNPGHRPLNNEEPELEVAAPEKPKGMGKGASREWDFLVPVLLKARVITSIDGPALAEYCKAKEISEIAYKDMKKHGIIIDEPVLDKENNPIKYDGQMLFQHKQNPAVGAWKTATGVMKSFLIEYGLTPASRAKLHIAPLPEGEESAGDAFLNKATEKAVADAKATAPLQFKTGKKTAMPDLSQLPGTATDFEA